MQARRGDIVLVDLSPTKGSETRGTRPAVVVQNDIGNQYSPTTIVVPLTTKQGNVTQADAEPHQPFLSSGTDGVKTDSLALCNQVRVISIDDRVNHRLGSVSSAAMDAIEDALEINLGLRPIP